MKKHLTLKLLTRVVCLIALAITGYVIIALVCAPAKVEHAQYPVRLQYFSYYSRQLGLAIMALFIAFKAKGDKGTYLVACFWASLVLNNVVDTLIINYYTTKIVVDAFTSAIAAATFIYSMQYFPERIDVTAIKTNIKIKPLRVYLNWLLKPLNIWGYFGLFIFALYLLLGLLAIKLPVGDFIIIATALMFMIINYRKDGAKGHNSILWLFWGVLSQLLLMTFFGLLNAFNVIDNPYINVVYSFLSTFVILTALFMSIFFADSFNTGVIIKRTLVNGFLFVLIILIYNTAEHYLMHTINEHLEINDAFSSSLLSGVLILAIRPLHHKLEHFLDHKFKNTQLPERS